METGGMTGIYRAGGKPSFGAGSASPGHRHRCLPHRTREELNPVLELIGLVVVLWFLIEQIKKHS